jgi:hypothetical protein
MLSIQYHTPQHGFLQITMLNRCGAPHLKASSIHSLIRVGRYRIHSLSFSILLNYILLLNHLIQSPPAHLSPIPYMSLSIARTRLASIAARSTTRTARPSTTLTAKSSIFRSQTTRRTYATNPMASIVETVRNTLGENLGGPAHKLSTHQFELSEVPDLVRT